VTKGNGAGHGGSRVGPTGRWRSGGRTLKIPGHIGRWLVGRLRVARAGPVEPALASIPVEPAFAIVPLEPARAVGTAGTPRGTGPLGSSGTTGPFDQHERHGGGRVRRSASGKSRRDISQGGSGSADRSEKSRGKEQRFHGRVPPALNRVERAQWYEQAVDCQTNSGPWSTIIPGRAAARRGPAFVRTRRPSRTPRTGTPT
jgi:hypothetical protein